MKRVKLFEEFRNENDSASSIVKDLSDEEKKKLEKALNVSPLQDSNDIHFGSNAYTVKLSKNDSVIKVSVEPKKGDNGTKEDAEKLATQINNKIAAILSDSGS